jgi:queuine/archaeosine tRNA-ribosyltransferase
MYQFVFDKWKISKQKMLDITIENAKKFMAWKPTFETVKVYPIQGTTKEEYLESFKRLISIGAFDTDDKVAIAFGGLATAGRHRPVEVIDYVTKSPEFKQYQKKFQFIHGFGIGNPERILSLYKLGVNSFDALTVCLLTNIGMYWLRTGKLARHLIHESPMTRRLRLHFNMNSFWGQLAELFSKHRNIPLKEELEKIDMSKIDEICEIQEEKE